MKMYSVCLVNEVVRVMDCPSSDQGSNPSQGKSDTLCLDIGWIFYQIRVFCEFKKCIAPLTFQ